MSRAAVVVATLVFASGCGIPTDSSPREFAVPDDVVLNPPAATTTTAAAAAAAVTRQVYMIGADGRLVVRERAFAEEPTRREVIVALVEGTTEAEQSEGITTSIPAETIVISTPSSGEGTLTVRLSAPFFTLESELRVQAAAQVVFSGTELQGVRGVLFEDEEGFAVAMPNQDNEIDELARPMTRVDYLTLRTVPAAA